MRWLIMGAGATGGYFGGLLARAAERERVILASLRAAGIDAELDDDARRVVWEKFVFLSPLAAVTSVTRAPIADVRGCPESRELLRRVIIEAVSAATARGVALSAGLSPDAMLATIDGLPAAMRTSMQRDLEAGRRIELEALCGVVTRYGREYGIGTPSYEVIYAALKPAALAADRARMAG